MIKLSKIKPVHKPGGGLMTHILTSNSRKAILIWRKRNPRWYCFMPSPARPSGWYALARRRYSN